jgi:2-dehydro-3-deoxyglucarate aldolase
MNRQNKIKYIRDNLRNGGHSVGSWMQIPHASVAEIMGQSGYEWVAVDMEHGSVAVHQLPDLFRALELGDTLPLVRLAHGHSKDCKQALDAGAGGVIVPMVESGEDLVAVRDACRWPPAGTRGVGFSRANLFGKQFQAYREEAQAPLLIAMIEHIRAVDCLDEILSVDGLDALLIGPYDLSASMGLTAEFDHPKFLSIMETIRAHAAARQIPSGIHVVAASLGELQKRIDEGYRFLAYSIDAVMLNQIAEFHPTRKRDMASTQRKL